MKDWADRLDSILQLNGRELLTHADKISHKMAMDKSGVEFIKFQEKKLVLEKEESFQELIDDIHKMENKND